MKFQSYFSEPIIQVESLNHVGNNSLYRVSTIRDKYLVKDYDDSHMLKWDRGACESSSLRRLNSLEIDQIPRFIGYDALNHIGIYSFEEGSPLHVTDVQEDQIDQLSAFMVKLRQLPKEVKKCFNAASTNGLRLSNYAKDVNDRLQYLNAIERPTSKQGFNFFLQEVLPLARSTLEKFTNTVVDSELPIEQQSLCFGDFGFHNVLYHNGSPTFVDFEYFGRDDPVRELLGFFHHDKHQQLSLPLRERLIESYLSQVDDSEEVLERMQIVEPLKSLSWTLTYLNALSPIYCKKFPDDSLDSLIHERLVKAEKKLKGGAYFSL